MTDKQKIKELESLVEDLIWDIDPEGEGISDEYQERLKEILDN